MCAVPELRRSTRFLWLAASVAGAGMLALAACGKSSTTTATTVGPDATTATTATAGAGVKVAAASVPGVGTVLVNGQGMTLYVLSSEAGGKITCTDESGCTKVWPDTELPSGVPAPTAGSGIDASKLGTVKNAAGNLYVTYAGYPLYTFAHDTGPGSARGQGIKSFGGTWTTMTAAGTPVSAPSAGSSTTSGATSTIY